MLAQIRQSIRDPLRFFCLLFVFLLSVLFRRTKAGNVAGRRNRDERGNKGPRFDARIIVAVSLLADTKIQTLCILTL